MRSITARALLAAATAAVAVLSLAYGDFVPRGQPVPGWLPREAWIDGSALLMLAVSGGLCFARTAQISLVVLGAYQVLWTLLCAPPVFQRPRDIGSWYGLCEALTPLLSAWLVWAIVRAQHARVAQALFGLTCVFYGYSHFLYADYTASMVPAWLPAHLGLAYFTGMAHMAAGTALIVGVLPHLAAALEATMMTLFGVLVWVPSFFMHPRPSWATSTPNQWSELTVNVVLAVSAWLVMLYLKSRARP